MFDIALTFFYFTLFINKFKLFSKIIFKYYLWAWHYSKIAGTTLDNMYNIFPFSWSLHGRRETIYT